MKDPKTGRFLKGHKSTPAERKQQTEKMKHNKYGTKLKDAELRQEAYRQYCEHISSGKPRGSWYFEHPTDYTKSMTNKTMERYIAENPQEFPAIKKEIALNKGYNVWFNKGQNLADGNVKGNPSPTTWQVIMRNMFDWDKESRVTHSVEPEARRLLEKLEE